MKIWPILLKLLLLPVGLVGLALLLILPFIVLIKSMIISYSLGVSTGMAMLIGSLAAFLVLIIYLMAIDRALQFRRKKLIGARAKLLIASVVVFTFIGYALFILSESNVKERKLANQYADVHPILRIAVKTWSLFDSNLVITDMSRVAKDYRRMRLRTYTDSLHYVQKNGYVHALDIRTIGRSAWRNWVTETMFRMMGLDTLRHGGTADHLHVELAPSKQDGTAREKTRLATRAPKPRIKKPKQEAPPLLAREPDLQPVGNKAPAQAQPVSTKNELAVSDDKPENSNTPEAKATLAPSNDSDP